MKTQTIHIKPMSVNKAWQGKRFKTKEYSAYEDELLARLRRVEVPEGPLIAVYEFGMSSWLSDWDNPVKPLQDILQKKHGFDDRRIILGMEHKVKVNKGSEYIRYRFFSYDDNNSLQTFSDIFDREL